MGYRKLLQQYMAHVEALLGTDLVEVATMVNTLDRRSISELRVLAAELHRERLEKPEQKPYAEAVKQMLYDADIRVDQLARIEGIEAADEEDDMDVETFKRIMTTMLFLAEPEPTEQESARR